VSAVRPSSRRGRTARVRVRRTLSLSDLALAETVRALELVRAGNRLAAIGPASRALALRDAATRAGRQANRALRFRWASARGIA
jgi:hypothetical protein